MELGKNFLRIVGKALISMLKNVPLVGMAIAVADDVSVEMRSIIAEQDRHSLEDRVKQLEEASECTSDIARKIAAEVLSEMKNVSSEKVEAVLDIMSAVPSNIKQKIAATLSHAKKNGTKTYLTLPVSAETSSSTTREQFYLGLIPSRRPKYHAGDKVPYKPGWIMEELLGIGGFGEVWKIREKQTNMLQAIKLCLEPEHQKLLQHEARTIAKLKTELKHHANIAEVLDLQLEEDPHWIMLEYVEGGTLESYLRSFGVPLALEKALEIFEPICEGIKEAHQLGIVHRDIKPGNILLTSNNIPKITDFGIGKIVATESCRENSQKQANTLTLRGYGTMRYMSPEQQNCMEIDKSDDVYSLAVVLYDMLAGMNRDVLMYKGVLKRLTPRPPEELLELFERSLGEERKYRIATAGELLEEIQKIKRNGRSLKKEIKEEAYIKKENQTKEEKQDFASQQSFKSESLSNISLPVEPAKKVIPGFSFLREAMYICGGMTHTVKEHRHDQTGLEFVQIPGGTFMMGSDDGYDNEKPVHQVTLSSFLMSKTPVTQGVWQKIMGNNPSYFKKGNDYPVESISWDDCQEFCKKTRLQLPTEAQWEYACRAGTTTKWYHGNDEKQLGEYAWYEKNSGSIFSFRKTHPVAQKLPNAFGLYDMMGNVWEWCQDWYGSYNSGSESDPKGPNSGSDRVYRGGSWNNCSGGCRSAFRISDVPSLRYFNLGVRFVLFLLNSDK